jgi:REP element-mobilizing transposase RayT
VERYPTRKRQRLKDFDYSAPGFYFVTICTAGRKTQLVDACADSVGDEMAALAVRFPGVVLDEHVVMPDHVHFILQLNGATAPPPRILQAFKSLTTRAQGHRFWQRGYYDHVIRDEEELRALREYIRNNPLSAEIARRGGKESEVDERPKAARAEQCGPSKLGPYIDVD